MDDSGPDESFASFLSHQNADQDTKNAATKYVEGFNAARAAEISVHSLLNNSRAEEKIQGDRMFRLPGGYNSLLGMMCGDIDPRFTSLHTSTIVKRIHWSGDGVVVHSEDDAGAREWHARAAVVTLPLGVLQAGDVEFDPPINAKSDALGLLYMGEVIRITLTFDHPLWVDIAGTKARDMRFLFAEDEQFPTWWTHLPEHVASITGWSASHHAADLSGRSEGVTTAVAATSLANILGLTDNQVVKSLSAAYTHDWQSDPYSRGAYSWPKVGGADAHRELSWPLDNRLFFAGEATDFTGHNGTVHGAISSGHRAAKEVLGYIRTRPHIP
jgi:monoamine oxidase